MPKTMSRRMVALSMASIAAVYLAGYAITEPAAQRIASAENGDIPTIFPPASAPSSQANPRTASATMAAPSPAPTTSLPLAPTASQLTPSATATTKPTATAVKTATPVPTPGLTSSGLKDGTYSATGVSRRGNVTVAVTVQGGRIAAVDITKCLTQYPQSLIDGLPSEVLARQNARVDLVSGATLSTHAFQSAVTQALARAQTGATAVG